MIKRNMREKNLCNSANPSTELPNYTKRFYNYVNLKKDTIEVPSGLLIYIEHRNHKANQN